MFKNEHQSTAQDMSELGFGYSSLGDFNQSPSRQVFAANGRFQGMSGASSAAPTTEHHQVLPQGVQPGQQYGFVRAKAVDYSTLASDIVVSPSAGSSISLPRVQSTYNLGSAADSSSLKSTAADAPVISHRRSVSRTRPPFPKAAKKKGATVGKEQQRDTEIEIKKAKARQFSRDSRRRKKEYLLQLETVVSELKIEQQRKTQQITRLKDQLKALKRNQNS